METTRIPSVGHGLPARRKLIVNTELSVARFGVALVLGWIGLFKFTPTEANAIVPLLEHSPLMNWLLPLFGVRGASNLIGTVEFGTAVLLVLGTWSARALLVGSGFGMLTFAATLSFLFTTPGLVAQHDGFWVADAFILKDVTLLGVCWSSFLSARRRLSRNET